MESLKKKLQYAFNSFDKKEISDYLSKIQPDGSFTDVNYEDQSRGEWLTYQHLRRAAELSCAYVEDPSLKDAVLSAVHFWYQKDYRNPNWWYNDLGVPQKLRLILLNCDHLLDAGIRKRMIERLQTDIEPKWTGMNRLWFAENLLFRGVITRDSELIQKASREMADTIFISQEGQEGVQVDASFAQHGMQLYNHGYGRDFLINSAKWLELLHDTPYALPHEKVKILTELYLQGTVRMGRFQAMDYSAQSREIVRCYREKNLQAGMQLYIPAARNLIKCNKDPVIRKKLEDTIEFIEGKRPNPYEESNTAFWVLKFMTHLRNGYYASVRMASKEVSGGDTNGIGIVNGENALGGFGAYGLCVYMRDGHEYEKIFPVMDWGCMPGTTTPDIELPLELGGVHESEFVGNVSDGLYGLSAMDQNKTFTYDGETVTFGGRFAYFLLDEGVLHLGNQLHCNSRKEFHTTLDQCLLKGEVLADGRTVAADGCFHELQTGMVSHNGKCYLNLDDHEWKLKAGEVTGSYERIFISDSTPKGPVTNQTFLLVMPHREGDTKYCYAVLPDADPDTAKRFRNRSVFDVLENDVVQAVRYKEQIMAVFYEATCLKAGTDSIAVDAPCMLIWKPKEGKLLVSSPDKSLEQLVVTVNSQDYRIKMPEDRRYRGKAITVTTK